MLDIRLVSIQDSIEGDNRSSVARLQFAFGVDARIARFFLANIPIFVKRNATTEEAKAYVQALHLIGAEVEIHRGARQAAAGSADRFQPDAMEKLRAAQAAAADEESFDERPDRFPDSVAPFMDEVPDAFPKSMDIRELTSPPGFDSKLGDAEMEQLLSYMPDAGDSSLGPLTMDLPDGYSLEAFGEFGLGEGSLDELGDLDDMGHLDDDEFPSLVGHDEREDSADPAADLFGYNKMPSLDEEPPPAYEEFAIEGNLPPEAPSSGPIAFPDDLLDSIGPEVDPDAIAHGAAAPSFTSDLDALLVRPDTKAEQSTVEENINDLLSDGAPPAMVTASGRTTQPELPTAALLSVPAAKARGENIPPPPAPPSRPVRSPIVPALPAQLEAFRDPAQARPPAPSFWSGVGVSFAAPLKGKGAAWLGVLATGCFVVTMLMALPLGSLLAGLGLGLTPLLLGGLIRYFTLSAEHGLDDIDEAPPLAPKPRAERPNSLLPAVAITVLFAIAFAAPVWAGWKLITAAGDATQASAPLTEWDSDQVWYDDAGKVLALGSEASATVAYDGHGAKVLVDPRRKIIHHIDAPRSQKHNPDVPTGPLLLFLVILFVPLLYWPMALSASAFSGSQSNVFNPVFVGAAMVKGGVGYLFVAVAGAGLTVLAAGVCGAMLTYALVGDGIALLVAPLLVFSVVVPYVHGVQGQWMGRLLAERRAGFTHFSGL